MAGLAMSGEHVKIKKTNKTTKKQLTNRLEIFKTIKNVMLSNALWGHQQDHTICMDTVSLKQVE